MPLPPELMRLLPGSLEVLRFMGREEIEAADTESLSEGTGMSARATGKAIRGLVTNNYLNMDESYIYYLTDKGKKAIQDIRAFDAEEGTADTTEEVSAPETVVKPDLVAVLPQPVPVGEDATLQVGFYDAPPVRSSSQLVLRISAVGGSVSPAEVTLDLQPTGAVTPQSVTLTPDTPDRLRVRIEAMQMVTIADVHEAGGIYFDVQVGDSVGELQAWHGSINLLAE